MTNSHSRPMFRNHTLVGLVFLLSAGLSMPVWAQGVMFVQNDNVGINTNDPKTKMHVLLGGTPFTPHPQTAMLFQNNGSVDDGVILSLIGGTGSIANGQINFGNTSNEFSGRIVYSFGTNAMRFFTGGAERMRVTSTGLGIGTTTPAGMLDVNGSIFQRGGLLHADYVFEPDYDLKTIEEHKDFMWQNKYLPAVGAGRYDEEGRSIIDVGSHTNAILEELEVAHIYISQLNDDLRKKESSIEDLKTRIEKLEALVQESRR